MNIVEELQKITKSFATEGVEYAICGGCAVVIYGYVRATKDIDLLVKQGDVERVFGLLSNLGFTLRAGPIPFGSGTPEERRLYRATKVLGNDSLTVDLVVVTPILEETWRDRRTLEWSGRALTVVSRVGLARMKRLAGRPQDVADLAMLGVEVETNED
jgi:hypothetical protein